MHASSKGHVEIVQTLLAVPGIKVNMQKKVPNNCILFAKL